MSNDMSNLKDVHKNLEYTSEKLKSLTTFIHILDLLNYMKNKLTEKVPTYNTKENPHKSKFWLENIAYITNHTPKEVKNSDSYKSLKIQFDILTLDDDDNETIMKLKQAVYNGDACLFEIYGLPANCFAKNLTSLIQDMWNFINNDEIMKKLFLNFG